MEPLSGIWRQTESISHKSYICGYCGEKTGVRVGYYQEKASNRMYICGGCNRPTFFDADMDQQTPYPILGNQVRHLPSTIEPLYEEARRCTQVNAYTACVLACRKILMHVAVEKGAEDGKKFIEYVQYLADKGYVPPDGKGWVDHIRNKGNEATHEIVMMNQENADELLSFVEMLLKFVYEFPSRIMPPENGPQQ